MKRSFIFLNYLLSVIVLLAGSLSANCGSVKKNPNDHKICFNGGCRCDRTGSGCGSDEIPPDCE